MRLEDERKGREERELIVAKGLVHAPSDFLIPTIGDAGATTHPTDGEIRVIATEAMDSEFSNVSPSSPCNYSTCSPLLISHGAPSVFYRCKG